MHVPRSCPESFWRGGDVRLYNSNERANEYICCYKKHHKVVDNEGIPRDAKNAKELAHVQDLACGSP